MLQLLLELPLPFPGASPVTFSLGSSQLTVALPGPLQLPLLDIDVRDLLENMTPQTLINLFVSLLTEQRILLFCRNLQTVFSVCEILHALIFPFRSIQVYAPVTPDAEVCEAPVPYMYGFHSDVLASGKI